MSEITKRVMRRLFNYRLEQLVEQLCADARTIKQAITKQEKK